MAARVPKPFIFMPKEKLAKEELISSQQGLNLQPFNPKASAQPIQPTHIRDNSSNSKIMLSRLTFKYIT